MGLAQLTVNHVILHNSEKRDCVGKNHHHCFCEEWLDERTKAFHHDSLGVYMLLIMLISTRHGLINDVAVLKNVMVTKSLAAL